MKIKMSVSPKISDQFTQSLVHLVNIDEIHNISKMVAKFQLDVEIFWGLVFDFPFTLLPYNAV